jgi:hypothetical protein
MADGPIISAALTQRCLPVHNAMVLLPALLQVIQQAIKRQASLGLALPARDVGQRLHHLVVVDAA